MTTSGRGFVRQDKENKPIHVLYPFQVPVFRSQVDDPSLNRELSDVILSRSKQSEGIQVSNRGGGWHSEKNLQDWPSDAVKLLLRHIKAFTDEMVRTTIEEPQPAHFDNWLIEAWANVNVKGAHNASHAHYEPARPTLWSGIYYVDPGQSSGDQEIEGHTVFEDHVGVPRDAVGDRDPFAHELTIEPRPGLMLMFPATLRHRVEPYRGDSRRITIAWNLYHPGFNVPRYEHEHAAHIPTIWGSRALWHGGQFLKAVRGVLTRPLVLVRRRNGQRSEANQRDGQGRPASLRDKLEDRHVSPLDFRQE